MGKLSEKYVAGFFDADGSVQVVFIADCRTPQLRVKFSQKTEQDEVLHLIQRDYGGAISYELNGVGQYSTLSLSGNTSCSNLLNRIKKHTVLKRRYIEVCLDMCSRQISQGEIERAREYLKIQRKIKSYPLPNFPPRKWLAGYFDGDGCVSASIRGDSGGSTVRVHIAAEKCYTGGIETIHKAFGGHLKPMRENVDQWYYNMVPSKMIEFFGYFGKHTVVKRSQIEFILKCAEMGHFRDGKNIVSALKHLKAHPHRLSEPKPDVHALFLKVEDIPPFRLTPAQYKERSDKAWKTRRAMRQSETVSA